LARFEPQPVNLKLEKVLHPATIRQTQNTFAVRAFDATYRSDPRHFRYEWSVEKRGWLGAETISSTTTRSPFYTAVFPDDGPYAVTVRAIDRCGYRSEPAVFDVTVELLKPEAWLGWLKWAASALGGTSLVYLIALGPLLLLYPRSGWARSAVNSGAFSRFRSCTRASSAQAGRAAGC